MKNQWTATFTLLLALGATGCIRGERISEPRPVRAGSARDAYVLKGGVDEALLRAWEDASRRAIRSGLSAGTTFRERLRLPADQPHAVAYSFMLYRGQTLDVEVEEVAGGPAPFMDVFNTIDVDMYRHVATPPPGSGTFSFTATADGEYVLRIQPAPGQGGDYAVTVAAAAGAMVFPVAGAGMSAIQSVWGDDRDGGARSHEGVDIFAPRGTPVVAVADGWITATQSTAAGGLVVWQRDAARDLNYYYAHLDEQLTMAGARVRAGDVLGTVGNTGNARGSSPHLHFGVYAGGRAPVDPAPLLAGALVNGGSDAAGGGSYSADLLGTWARARGSQVRLRTAPSTAGSIITELDRATPVLILGAVGGWHRVLLADGTTGFISAEYTGR